MELLHKLKPVYEEAQQAKTLRTFLYHFFEFWKIYDSHPESKLIDKAILAKADEEQPKLQHAWQCVEKEAFKAKRDLNHIHREIHDYASKKGVESHVYPYYTTGDVIIETERTIKGSLANIIRECGDDGFKFASQYARVDYYCSLSLEIPQGEDFDGDIEITLKPDITSDYVEAQEQYNELYWKLIHTNWDYLVWVNKAYKNDYASQNPETEKILSTFRHHIKLAYKGDISHINCWKLNDLKIGLRIIFKDFIEKIAAETSSNNEDKHGDK